MLEIDFDFRGDPLGGQISDCEYRVWLIQFSANYDFYHHFV